MSSNEAPFQGKAFRTAAARRGRPIRFTVEYWAMDVNDIDDDGHAEIVRFMVDPNLDIVRVGKMFGSFQDAMKGLRDPAIDDMDKLATINEIMPPARDALRECFVPICREDWDRVAPTYDIQSVAELISWIVGELTSLDPTPRASSTIGSESTGPTSKDDAQPVESTSTNSPMDELSSSI